VKSPSRLLIEIGLEDAQDGSPIFVDSSEDAEYWCTSAWRGLVSGQTYVCYSEALVPTGEFFRAAEKREMSALEENTVGGMQ
jgi:hypothetical protein